MSSELESLTEALSAITETAEAWFKGVRESEAAGLLPSIQSLNDARGMVEDLDRAANDAAAVASQQSIILPPRSESHSLQWLREAIHLLRERTESELRRRLNELRELARSAQSISLEKSVKWEPLAAVGAAADQLLRQLESTPEPPSAEFIEEVGRAARPLEALVKLVSDRLITSAEGASLFAEVSSAFSPELAFAAARNQIMLQEKDEGSLQPPKVTEPPGTIPVAQETVDVAVEAEQSPPPAATIPSTGIRVMGEPSAAEKQIDAAVSKIIGGRTGSRGETVPDSNSLVVLSWEAGPDTSQVGLPATPEEPSASREPSVKVCESESVQESQEVPRSDLQEAKPEGKTAGGQTISGVATDTLNKELVAVENGRASSAQALAVGEPQPPHDITGSKGPLSSRTLAEQALSAEFAVKIQLAIQCAWQLVIEGYPGLGLALLQAVQRENPSADGVVPSWALRMAILGPMVSEPAGEIARLLAADFSRIEPGLFDQTPQEGGIR